jgi:hypothetical protein
MSLFHFSQKVENAIPFIFFFILIVYSVKPNILFKPNGKLREFGLFYDNEGYKKTLYNFQFLLFIFVLILYYLV